MQPSERFMRVIRALDAVGEWSGRVFSWLLIPLMLGLVYEVVARYVFHRPTIWAHEVATMMYGSHFMLGAGYALLHKGHIRTDFLYDRWPARRQALVDALLYVCFFFPGLFLFLLAGWETAAHSWLIRERSEISAWRPPMYPFKTVIPVTAALLLIQGASEFLKCIYALRTGRWP